MAAVTARHVEDESGAPSVTGSRWVYVAGDGRSGSTLLGSLMAAALGAFDCGELHLLWVSRVDGRLCTCGVEVAQCPVWAAVAAEVRDRLDLPDDKAVADIAQGRLRQRQLLGPRLPGPHRDELALRWATEAAIERVTGVGTFVDSSKLSSVLWTASHLPRSLGVVHLVRDPRAVAFSWSRPTPDPSRRGAPMETKSTVRSATDWLRAHVTIERVLRRLDGDRVVRIRYEDLVREPAGLIASITGDSAGDSAPMAFAADDAQPSHAIAGNPTRFRTGQRISPDERWRREMSGPARAVATAITAPLLHRFGYRLWDRAT
jgi:sulfotransferase family protein